MATPDHVGVGAIQAVNPPGRFARLHEMFTCQGKLMPAPWTHASRVPSEKCMCIYIYVYQRTCSYMYIYIYVYI